MPAQPKTVALVPPGRRERTKAENRAAILAAARRVFVEIGYETATVRDVIGATGLAAGTFYNYFPDKESVLRALLDEKMSEMQERSATARMETLSVEETIRRTLDIAFGMLVEDRDVFELLRRNAGAIRATLDEPGYVESTEELREDLERALAREGSTGIDTAYLAAAISGLAFEVATVAVERGPAALDSARRFSESMILGGIAALDSNVTGAGATATKRAVPAPAAAPTNHAATASAAPRTKRPTPASTTRAIAKRTSTARKPSC